LERGHDRHRSALARPTPPRGPEPGHSNDREPAVGEGGAYSTGLIGSRHSFAAYLADTEFYRLAQSHSLDVEVASGVTVVLPLLVEDHMQARPNGMFAIWMTGRVGWYADPLELRGGDGANRLSDLVHTLPS
jgi:hypothetical protein